jgi:hypothetical protein
MSLPLQKHESFTQEGSGVSNAIYTVVNAGLYRAYISATYGLGSTIAGSIVQAGSASAVAIFPSPVGAQTHGELNTLFVCAPGDTIAFAISTSDPTNSVKSLFNVVQTNSGI